MVLEGGQCGIAYSPSYSGVMGSSWAIDDATSQPVPNPVTYQWSPTTAMTPADGAGQTVTVSPTVTTDYTVTAILAGCAVGTSSPITVTVNPLPICSIVGPAGPVCTSSANIYSAPAGLTSYEWSITGNGNISSGSGAQNVTVTAGTGCNNSYILTLRITDANGCINTCSSEVNVVDNTPPIVTLPAANLSMECFDASIVSAWAVTASATDDCGGVIPVIPSYLPPVNNCNHTIIVTFTSTDACGNIRTATKTFSVNDDTAPVIIPPSENLTLSCFDATRIAAWAATASATDNCRGTITVTTSYTTPTSSCNQTVTVTFTASDACGNIATLPRDISINDNIPPVINCPVSGEQTVDATTGNTYVHTGTGWDATATDNCGIPTLSYSLSGATTGTGITTLNGVTFNAGTTTVNWRATDICGNYVECSFTVTVYTTADRQSRKWQSRTL